MSVIGKGQLSLRKRDVIDQKSIGVGFSKVIFATEAVGGESSINLANLNTPASMSSQGFTQPSPGTLADLNIYSNRDNLTLISSVRGLLVDFMSYRVMSNSSIKFNGFTLLAGEVITGIIDPVARTGLVIADGEAIAATGELEVGETDFSVGTPFEVNKYPTQQIGAVKVYRNGLLQVRCEGNDDDNLGNYIEVPVSGGFGTIIRFVNAPVDENDAIVVTSNGAYFERPTASSMAAIETLGGQMDKVIEVLADVSGLDESDFQSNPNQVNLREFGDRVIEAENDITELRSDATVKWQKKLAGSTISVSDANFAGLRFNNLTIGKTYRVTVQMYSNNAFSSADASITMQNNAVTVADVQFNTVPSTEPQCQPSTSGMGIFVATATTLIAAVAVGASATISSNSNVILEELPFHVQTTDWT